MKKIVIIATFILMFVSSALYGQEYEALSEKSVILWEGKAIGKVHNGTIKLKEGIMKQTNSRPESGRFSIDMTSIINSDLGNENMKGRLEKHLKSADFFDVENFPVAVFEIENSEMKDGGSFIVKGVLMIKGIAHPIEFSSNFSTNESNLVFTGHIDVDRTLYDVRYNSSRFFKDIGDKAINDIFGIDFEIYFSMSQ